MAAIQYAKRVSLHWKLLAAMCAIAMVAAFTGSYILTLVSNTFMKPAIFCMLILVAVYTYSKKDFGTATTKVLSVKKEMLLGCGFALAIGFYDGFIGPGAGSFLILFFISIVGFDFLRASAHAKFVNLATNIGSIIFFSGSGQILYRYALPMAVFNFAGSYFGSRLAILKGNKFIRIFFLIVITATILRFGYDIFIKHP
jgi:uncharacterized membrane protein YfcA